MMTKFILGLILVLLPVMGQRTLSQQEKNQGWFLITIPSGSSLTQSINVSACILTAIEHDTWTAADISLSVSLDGATFSDAFDEGDTEIVIKARTTAQTIVLPSGNMWFLKWVKFRSGTSAVPVNQGAERILKVGCR
jgi:hypothetical protein